MPNNNYFTRPKTNLNPHLFLKPLPLLGSSNSKFKPLPCLLTLCSYASTTTYETLIYLLKKCSTIKDLKQIHARIVQAGFEQNLEVIGRVLGFCSASERDFMSYAVSVFEKVENPDGFLWNTLIRGFGRSDEPEMGFVYYKNMQGRGLVPDNFTFSFLVKACEQLGSVLLGRQMHCRIFKYGFQSHAFVRNNLMQMYGMFKDVEIARQLFEEIPSPELVAWNTIIDCHVCCGKYREALQLFSKMWKSGMEPDQATLIVTLSACSSLGALDFGRWIHHYFLSNGDVRSILNVNNALIDMYAKCGAIEEAREIFSSMSKKNIVTWNSMIFGLATHGYAKEALQLFFFMLEQKLVVPDGVTFLGVLSACGHGGMVDEGRRLFDRMIKEYGIQPTIKHYGSMVDILSRAGFVEEAYQLIKSMPIGCNAIVLRTLLAACNLHRNVELGEQVRVHLLELDPDHSSDYVLLANMYASAGQQNDAMRVRKSMRKRGVQKPEHGNSFIGMH